MARSADRFALLRRNVEVKSKAGRITALENALDFAKAFSMDLLSEGKFTVNLEHMRENHFKVAVLKARDAVGEILSAALEKYGIEVIFHTAAEDFQHMSEEEFERCRQADIVISANVHSKKYPNRGGAEQCLSRTCCVS